MLEFLDDFCRRENQRIGLEISTEGEEETYSTAYDFFYLPIDFRYTSSNDWSTLLVKPNLTFWCENSTYFLGLVEMHID